MCLLCNDEIAYLAYMDELEAMKAEGKEPDLDRALDAAVSALDASDKKAAPFTRTSMRDDYISAFICDPVEK